MNKFFCLLVIAPVVLLACGGTSGKDEPVPLPDVAKSSLAYNSVPVVSTDTQQAVINDLNNFGSAVFQGVAPSDQNFIVSPVGGFIALTMTSDGAHGKTADEMKAVLYPDVSLSDIQAATNQLEQRVRGYAQPSAQTSNGEKKIELNLANDVFVQKDMSIRQPFLDNLAANYNCGVELVDFKTDPGSACTRINNWVASETNSRIQNLLTPASMDDLTRLVLVDALYLNSSWQTAFDANSTQAQTFHGISGDSSTDFMNAFLSLNYASGSGWVGVDVPYYGGSLVLTAILPDSGQFGTIRASLAAAWFSNFDAVAQQLQIRLALPKFKVAGSSVSWKQTLLDLGMTTAFDSGTCDLTGIATSQDAGGNLYIKDVLQKVYVELAEKGTEAAAATAVIMGVDAGAMALPSTSVVFDRPFLYFVREHAGPILFAGQVVSLP